jgi:hypothetical protein
VPHRGASPGLLRHNNQPKMGSDINHADCNYGSAQLDFLFSSGQWKALMVVLCGHNQLQSHRVWVKLMEVVSNITQISHHVVRTFLFTINFTLPSASAPICLSLVCS